jgi:predicted nucleic acid-binding protein
MGLILDSSPLIAYEKRQFDLMAFLATHGGPIVIAAITASELLHGVHRAPDARLSQKRADHVEWILSTFETIPFALDEARHHSRIWAQLASAGKMIGYHDLLIAATALSLGYPLATLNFDEFARVPGLMLVEKDVLLAFRPA